MSTFKDYVNSVEEKLSVLEQSLEVISEKTRSEASLTVVEQCRNEVLLSFALNTLMWSLLQIQGTPVKDHPVIAEIERSRKYIEKVKVVYEENKPKTRVNAPAAGRFIKHSLAANYREDIAKRAKHRKD